MNKDNYGYGKMLPDTPIPGHIGYYPVASSEEWDNLPDLFKVMEWEPVKDPFNNNRLSAVKAVVFDVTYMEPYGIRANVSVHPEEVHKILFCSFDRPECHLYSICEIELEGGSRLPAKWYQDSRTGAFAIYALDRHCVARQGGFEGFIPKHIDVLEDGTFKFNFKYNEAPIAHYTLLNPFTAKEKIRVSNEKNVTGKLIDAMSEYAMENNWSDSDFIDVLRECGIEYEDFVKSGYGDYAKNYFEDERESLDDVIKMAEKESMETSKDIGRESADIGERE